MELFDPHSFTIPGVLFSGIAAGIKPEGALDLGAIVIPEGATWVAATTRNSLKAAPVRHLEAVAREGGKLYAVLVNSGNANACTGRRGEEAVRRIVKGAGTILGTMIPRLPPGGIVMASTGVIGVPLPVAQIARALPRLFSAEEMKPHHLQRFAQAIMTTDRFPKVAGVTISLPGRRGERPVLVGIAKGAGMIAPNLATMLAFLITNLAPPRPLLRRLFIRAVEESFNRITVDGEMSTNDLVLCAACRDPRFPWEARWEKPFFGALLKVMGELSLKIVQDGEGARKLAVIEVSGARTHEEALALARRVANSLLVKTALSGEDPNWGRIAQALGSSGIPVQERNLKIAIGGVTLYSFGVPRGEEALLKARAAMAKERIPIQIVVGKGPGKGSVYTCDIGIPYVELNSRYRS